jgi:hypothetical protein
MLAEGQSLKTTSISNISDLMKRIGDALEKDFIVLTLRSQDAVLLRRHFRLSQNILSVSEILNNSGIEYVDEISRIATIITLKEQNALPFGLAPETVLFKRDSFFNKFVSFLRKNKLFDVPLILPNNVFQQYTKKGVVILAPYFLQFDKDALEPVASESFVFKPLPQSIAKLTIHKCTNVAQQGRTILRLEPDIVVAPSVSISLLTAYETIETADSPKEKFLFYDGDWRNSKDSDKQLLSKIERFGEVNLRNIIFALKNHPFCSWQPNQDRMLLCTAYDMPLAPFKRSVIVGAVQKETNDFLFSKALHLVRALTTDELHIMTYEEADGKPTFPCSEISFLMRSGTTTIEEKDKGERFYFAKEEPRKHRKSGDETKRPLYGKTFSPSSLETYSLCPRKFFYKYILNLPEEERSFTILGTVIHKILELHHSGSLKTPIEEQVKSLVLKYGKSLKEGERSLIEKDCLSLINKYIEKGIGNIGETIATERGFRFNLGDIEITGRIDRIVKAEDGYIAIDYKTRGEGQERAHKNRLSVENRKESRLDYQVPLYIEAMRQEKLTPVSGFCYIYLDFDSTGEPRKVYLPYEEIEKNVNAILDKAVEVAKRVIADTEFDSTEDSPCRSPYQSEPCPYLGICPKKRIRREGSESD